MIHKPLFLNNGILEQIQIGDAPDLFQTYYFYDFDDFVSGINTGKFGWTNTVASGGTATIGAVQSTHIGVLNYSITNNNSSRSCAILNPSLLYFAPDTQWYLTYDFRLSNLSAANRNYRLVLGFIDNSAGINQTDGAYFWHDNTTNAIICRTANNGTITSVITGVNYDTGWHNYRIEVDGVSEARFFRDNILLATINTNIPSGSARATSIGHGIFNAGGPSQATILYVDCMQYIRTGVIGRN